MIYNTCQLVIKSFLSSGHKFILGIIVFAHKLILGLDNNNSGAKYIDLLNLITLSYFVKILIKLKVISFLFLIYQFSYAIKQMFLLRIASHFLKVKLEVTY